ncbi:hypothetical protein ACTA71_005371 [Dictyostelium dimigraforme]
MSKLILQKLKSKNIKYFILIFVFYISGFTIVNCQQSPLNKIEYDCLKNLLTNLGTINKVSKNNTSNEYLFCGTWDNYYPTVDIACQDGYVSKLGLGQGNLTYIVTDEYSCFKNMTELKVVDIVFDKDKFFNSYPPKAETFSFDGSNLDYGSISPIIKTFSSSSSKIKTPTLVKFSWYLNTTKITFSTSIQLKGFNIVRFDNDLDGSIIWDSDIRIDTLNIPSLNFIRGSIYLTLLQDYDQSTWSNISTFGGMRSMVIIAQDISTFPTQISQLRAENLTYIYWDVQFLPVSSIIDLSFIGKSIYSLTFKNPNNFTFGGKFPIILPSNEAFKTLSFTGGKLQNFDFSMFTNVQDLKLNNNSMSNEFPSTFNRTTHKKLKSLDISNNKITGTIDNSFCDVDIVVYNNLMTGLIPPCFSCFFGLPEINLEENFAGNNFLNLNTPSSPSIIIPNIVFSNITILEGLPFNLYEYYIYGENLGGSRIPYNSVSDSIGTFSLLEVQQPNKLFKLTTYGQPSNPLKLSYSKSNPNYIFTLSFDNTPPQLNTVDWQSSTTDLIIDGSYFTYNSSIVTITIGDENCLVTSTTFYQIKCTLSNVIDSSLQDILSYITIGNLTTQFTLNPSVINTILNCTNNYNDCNGNGYCLSDIGKCKCDSNYQGDDCSLPYIECLPNDCNYGGVCNNITGECQCDSNHQGNACELPFKECLPNDCNGNGICKNTTGECQCDSNHQGSDCSIPYVECLPNDCNNGGVCTNTTGKCQCDSNHQGNSCELPFKECLNQCNNNLGKCNNQTGICTCPINPHAWSGIDCSIPLHTISGVSPSNTNGGIASIYGWFGNIHTGKQVFIGNQECTPIYNITETEIICNSPAGTGLKSISVIQNSINVTSKDIYQYYSNDKQCPNHCTSTLNGICNSTTGYCNCIGRWSGYDCSLYSNTGGGNNNDSASNTTIDSNTGGTNINNQQTNYEILITKLIEIDFNGNSINEYSLQNKWTIISSNRTIYTFIQPIQNNQCNITYTIEEINNDRDVSFAGIDFKLTSGSVKMTVSVENYQYSSNLNTLQLQMKSSVSEIQTNDKNDCNNDQIEINSTPNQDNTLNYIAIKKDAKVLNGRFLDRIESDGKSTFMQTVLISKSNDSITVGMNLPHCTKKCLLDPDFSVLISSEFVDECSDDKRESWFLPVVIAVPVGCTAAIVGAAIIVYKKRFIELPLKRKLKSFGINGQQPPLNKIEYDCLENLLTNLGLINKVSYNNTSKEFLFCGTAVYLYPMVYIACKDGYISYLALGQGNLTYIVTDEYSCFKNMTELKVVDIVYDKDKFFNSYPPKAETFSFDGSNLVYGSISPIIKKFSSVISTQKIPTSIKFSLYLNTTKIDFQGLVNYKGSHLIRFDNDLDGSIIWDSGITIKSLNVPSLNFIRGSIDLTLLQDYDQSTWSNISTFGGMRSMVIIAQDISTFPTQISQLRAENLTYIYWDVQFLPVSSIIDLSFIGKSIYSLTFKNPNNFTFGGKFPIILPSNEAFKTLSFTGGKLQNFDFSMFTNVQDLKLNNNSMSNEFPSTFNRTTHKKLKSLDISNNKITGTIDNSFCDVDIVVYNNLMTGLIPPCFSCFFGLPEINLEENFAGNNFLNLNTPSSPSTIIPNIVFSNITILEGLPFNLNEYYIYGENLGGGWVPYNSVSDSIGTSSLLEVQQPNKLFKLTTYGQPSNPLKLSYSKSNPNYIFTLSFDNTPPQLNTVDWQSSTTDLIIDGSYFTYNSSIVTITIGDENCLVTSTTFYQIKCTLSNVIDSSLQDILSYITIGNLTTQFTLNPGSINTILNCTNNYNDCNGNGYCLSDIGKCKCDSNYQGDDCSLPYIECLPNDCNYGGVCTNTTGKCQCDSNHQGNSCELPFKECLNQCNNNLGKCNNQTGICTCPINPHAWSGIDCSIPLHTISGASPSNTNGGIASIYGWFGNIHTGKQVFIGNQECTPIHNFTETEIICNSPAGTGLKSISVIQNSINVTSKDIYQYYSNDKQCPNHCTSTLNGICNSTTGYCNCIGRWSGYDCSLYSNTGGGNNNGGDSNNDGGNDNNNNNNGLPVSNTTIDSNTGGTNINNQQTNYEILITKLIEIDFNGNSINEYSLQNKWTIISSNSNRTIYTFIQPIQNNQCNITYTIEEINNDRNISFAGINFKLTSGSVKMTVSVENYQYSSNLNTLQLQMKSSVSEIQTNDKNDCNNDQIEINSTPNQDNTLNYIAIKKDAKVLNGRFIDRIESDGKSTFMQTVLISKSNNSITVGMNLPHCTKKCLLDPDFSVLISSEFVDECSDDKRESWFLPVVIAVPVGCTAAIVGAAIIVYKKRFVELPLKRKLKSFGSK